MATITKMKPPGRVKSAVLSWLGVPIDLTSGQFWASYYGTNSASGQSITAHSVLQLSTVWACVRLIAGTIATLPLNLYQRNADGGRSSAKTHPLYEILHNQPNGDMTAVQFWEAVLASLLLWGNSFCEIIYSGKTIISIDFLLPSRMAVRRLSNGTLEYKYTDLTGKQRVIPEDRMFHIPAFSLDGIMGVSPIRAGANVFGSALAADNSASATFRNGLMPSVYFKFGQWLKKEQREEFRANLESIGGAINAGKSPLLEGGIEAGTIGINPNDAQLLESRGFSVEEVCRWFGVTPSMVAHSEKSTSWGTGIEQQMIGFVTFTLRPWLARIEQSIRKCLLTPAERLMYFAEFSVEGLLRADSAARASFYASASQNGWMTRAEIRKLENLPNIEGSDDLTAQSNLLPLHLLGAGNTSQTEAAKSAFREWLGIVPEEKRDAP